MQNELKEKLKASIKEMLEDIQIEKLVILEMLEIAENYVNDKPYTLENHLTMIGFATETNTFIPKIKDEKTRNELDEKAEILWNKWYEKSQKHLEENSYLEIPRN